MHRLILLAVVSCCILYNCVFGQNKNQLFTASSVTNAIKQHVACKWRSNTIDTYKCGDTNTVVTGIAVCMYPSIDVLKKAVEQNCNMIISHEPLFYNHADDTSKIFTDDVYKEKVDFIRKHRLVVWRFHDHWHLTSPDGILTGVENKLGWNAYKNKDTAWLYKIPSVSVAGLVKHIQQKLDSVPLRVIGDMNSKVTNVAFSPGAYDGEVQIKMLACKNVDVLICGEAREWETYEYAYDAFQLKKTKALIVTGHAVSESAGMEYCATWLKQFIKQVPVYYIPRQNAFKVLN